jgi:tetratricopeptide (TPR) repeat protein
VPALAVGAADRLARMAVWWHGLYARLGTSAVPIPRLPSWLADRLPDGTDSNGISWTVATLDAERRATATLSRMAVDAHRDVWPVAANRSTDIVASQAAEAHDSLRRAVAAAGPVDEALAWLTEELDLDDEQLTALAEAIGYPSRDLGRTGIVLTRRLLAAAVDGQPDGDPVADARRATLTVALGARYSEVGRWDEARRHTEQAVHILHRLVVLDRDRCLPDLAGAVANLAACLAQLGEREEALTQSYEAVTLYRELAAHPDRAAGPAPASTDVGGGGFVGERYMPELARALSTLTTCLSRAGRRTAALGAAGQSVALYRELARDDPLRYAAELASAEHNWRVCRGVLGEPIAGARPAPG